MKEEQEHELLNRWINGEIEEQELRQFLPDDDIRRYTWILNSVDQLVPSNDAFVFDPKVITIQRKQPEARSLNWWIPMSMAASFLVLLMAGLYYFQNGDITYQTAFGETKNFTLPDQSTAVALAANSQIDWESDQWEKGTRSLVLEGHAYFDVTEKGAFSVKTTLGVVEVLGTRFDVNEMEDMIEVKCYEGIVSVQVNNESPMILEAGNGALYYQNRWEEVQVLTTSVPTWTAKLETFQNAPLIQVIKFISTQYDVSFEMGNVDLQRRFTGTVPNDNLTLALKIVFNSLEIDYEIKERKIILSE